MSEPSRPFLSAQWRNLDHGDLAVDAARIIDRVPAGNDTGLVRGQALVSLVGFISRHQSAGRARSVSSDFEEVICASCGRVAPDEDVGGASSSFASWCASRGGGMARLLYRDPIRSCRCAATCRASSARGRVSVESTGRWCTVARRRASARAASRVPAHWRSSSPCALGLNGEPGKETLEYRIESPRGGLGTPAIPG